MGFLLFFSIFGAFSQISAPVLPEAAPWNELLNQTSGWLAADGVYSIRNPESRCVYFLFSDTFCGSTQNDGKDFGEGVFMANHSFVKLTPEGNAEFFVPERGQNLLPDRYWLQDGTFQGNRLHFTAMIPDPKTWKPLRLDWVSLPFQANGTPDFANAEIRRNVPLLAQTPKGPVVFGAAFTEDAGDGFLYVFGYLDQREAFSRKDLVAARVRPSELTNFSAWRFLTRSGWSEDPTQCEPLAEGISCEFSVSRIPSGPLAGRFLLVDTQNGISPLIEYRTAPTPTGPFSPPTVCCRVPEHQNGISAYNSKAHPAISTSETLILSANLNRLGSLPHHPQEYRPRFFELRWDALVLPDSENLQKK